MPRTKLSNEQFASTSIAFMVGCELAGLEPSPRQAGKFRRHQGAARLQYDALVQDNTRRNELNERFFTRKAAALKQPEEIA